MCKCSSQLQLLRGLVRPVRDNRIGISTDDQEAPLEPA